MHIADSGNSRIRKVFANGTITTVVGNGTKGYNGDGIHATSTEINYPHGASLDSVGNIYIADSGNNRIRKVFANGTITTVAGNGTAGYNGDGISATSAWLYYPQDVVLDSVGNMYIADSNNNRIRKVFTNGTITTVAGNGTRGFTGDGIPATSTGFDNPLGVALDSVGNMYYPDFYQDLIRKVYA
jgi:hypothetical protein